MAARSVLSIPKMALCEIRESLQINLVGYANTFVVEVKVARRRMLDLLIFVVAKDRPIITHVLFAEVIGLQFPKLFDPALLGRWGVRANFLTAYN